MAVVINDLESRRGRPELYPWEEWSDGKARKLTQGEDFNSGLFSMRTMIHRKARNLSMKAITRIDEGKRLIEVQFYKDE